MWDALGPVLVGAGATLGATTFVQLWIVPRVETRKRRDERWERDLRDLGEVLAFDFPKARSGIQHTLSAYAVVAEALAGGNATTDRVNDFIKQDRARLTDGAETFSQVCERVEWLAEQVQRRAYGGKELARLRSATLDLLGARMALVVIQPGAYWRAGDDAPSREDVARVLDGLGDAHRALQKAVRELTGKPPPPVPSRTRNAVESFRSRRLQRRRAVAGAEDQAVEDGQASAMDDRQSDHPPPRYPAG